MSLIPPATVSARAGRPGRTFWRVFMGRAARGVGLVLALAWSLLLIAWLTLHWAILPHIQQWRGSIETRAGAALGVPVRIGSIAVRSSGWVPSFELREVTLQGPDGRPALRLPRVFAAISPRSLLSFELDFEQLLIDGPELELRRDAQGRIFVAGLDFQRPGNAANDDGAAADWFFRQREFVIRGGSVRWIDEQRKAVPITLAGVDFVLRNGLRGHQMRFDATPPAAFGERFRIDADFAQPLLARRGDWRRWTGSVFASLPRADVRELGRHVTLPFDLREGAGSLRGWFDIRQGEAVGATVDLALQRVLLRLGPALDPLDFAQIEGRLVGERHRGGASLRTEHFGFSTRDGMRWPPSALALAWQQQGSAPASGGSFSADRLDLGLLARIATRLPVGDASRRLLDDLRPEGVASAVDASWTGPLDQPAHYRVKTRVAGLTLAARPDAVADHLGRPGIRNASLQIDASDTGGSGRVDIEHGALDLPGVFAEPLLPVDRFAGQVTWRIDANGAASATVPRGAASALLSPASPSRAGTAAAPSQGGSAVPAAAASALPPSIMVQLKDARFANADARAEFDLRWRSGAAPADRYPGHLELDGKLGNGLATRVSRYLPLGLPRGTRDYLGRALQGGRLANASFHVRGDLREFPFFETPRPRDKSVPPEGEFRIAGRAEDLSFAYVPGAAGSAPAWPMLTRTSAELALDRGTFTIRNGRGLIGDTQWERIDGSIQHLGNDPWLALAGVGHGPLAGMLRYVESTPIGGWLGGALARATAAGNADATLELGLPLDHLDAGSTVRGSLLLAGNDVRLTPDTPLLARARGRIGFTQKGFDIAGASARVYGGDASFGGGTQADGSVRFNGAGSISAEGLRQGTELGPVARLANRLTGRADYRLDLGFVHGRPELTVSSNLVGIASDLPAPLAKPAATPLALRYHVAPDAEPPGAAPRESLQVELGNLLQVRYVREASGASSRVVRGGIGVQEPMPAPASGVAAAVRVKVLDVDAWQAVETQVFGETATRAAASAPGAAAPATGADGGYEPSQVALHADQLDFGGRRLTRVAATLAHVGNAWQANVDADQLAGYVEYRMPRAALAGGAAGGARVFARLSRLSLPKTEADQVSTLLDSEPASVPALDVVVDDFELRGIHLGRVEVEALNRAAAGPPRTGGGDASRDWRLTKFNVTTPEAQFTGSGLWAASATAGGSGTAPARRMTIDFRLHTSDAGALLDRLGTKQAIRGGQGELSGRIGWLGSPFSLDYPSLDGQVAVAIDAGQFLKADPGAARLLSVLSLQSLPRRLSLDFRDVFEQGFAFDSIAGDVAIAQGVARSNNLRMRGVQAAVLMEGSADIEHETQDLRVVVVPEINAGTAALAYAVINPAIGLGAFLAQVLLRKPLAAAGTREFHVSGSWSDPKVESVARRVDEAAAPASASAASGTARDR